MDLVAEKMIDKVNRLEQELNQLPQGYAPVWHHFAPGLYARQMLIKAGDSLTGAVHRTEHLCIVSGNMLVLTDEGPKHICALQVIFQSLPGIKRAGQAIDDTYFTTVHATSETDLEKLVEELTFSTARELLGGPENVQLMNNLLGFKL